VIGNIGDSAEFSLSSQNIDGVSVWGMFTVEATDLDEIVLDSQDAAVLKVIDSPVFLEDFKADSGGLDIFALPFDCLTGHR
jgi:hypothetical protein